MTSVSDEKDLTDLSSTMSGPLSFGRVTAALATVHNESWASLATANLDFTLMKVEASVEFGALGAKISRKRRIDAEEGVLHKTVWRLGVLFGEQLPPTEDLLESMAPESQRSHLCRL